MLDGSCATSLLAECPNLDVCEPMSHRAGLCGWVDSAIFIKQALINQHLLTS